MVKFLQVSFCNFHVKHAFVLNSKKNSSSPSCIVDVCLRLTFARLGLQNLFIALEKEVNILMNLDSLYIIFFTFVFRFGFLDSNLIHLQVIHFLRCDSFLIIVIFFQLCA